MATATCEPLRGTHKVGLQLLLMHTAGMYVHVCQSKTRAHQGMSFLSVHPSFCDSN